MNSSLQLQMQLSSKAEKTKQEAETNESMQLTKELQDKNAELMAIVEEKAKKEEKLNKKIEQQRESLKEWEKNSRQVYKELKRNEILQEKERYEMLLQLK